MKFTANPVEVTAFVIKEVSEVREDGSVRLVLEDRTMKTMCSDAAAIYEPVIGDYFVILAPGIERVEPKAVFERKYCLSPRGAALTVHGDGSITGDPAEVAAFNEFRRARPELTRPVENQFV